MNSDYTNPKFYLEIRPALYNMEKALILKSVEESGGNHSLAARYCKISRTTLLTKLKQYEEEDKAPTGGN